MVTMSQCRILLLLALLLGPLVTHAQEDTTGTVFDYVEELNAMCPVTYAADWGVNSYTMVGDNYALVDVMIPSNLTMILSSLTAEGDNVKRLWIKQLKQYGDQWLGFVDRMVETNHPIVVNLHPKGSNQTALITLYPSDFKEE